MSRNYSEKSNYNITFNKIRWHFHFYFSKFLLSSLVYINNFFSSKSGFIMNEVEGRVSNFLQLSRGCERGWMKVENFFLRVVLIFEVLNEKKTVKILALHVGKKRCFEGLKNSYNCVNIEIISLYNQHYIIKNTVKQNKKRF